MKSNKTETWISVSGFEDYQISDLGRVKCIRGGYSRLMSTFLKRDGYLYVKLRSKGHRASKSIHRLVAEAFIPNLDCKPQVNHINGNKTVNSTENLEWVTAKENLIHAVVTGLRRSRAFDPNRKFNEKEVRQIRQDYATGNFSQRKLGQSYGVGKSTIGRIVTKELYKEIS